MQNQSVSKNKFAFLALTAVVPALGQSVDQLTPHNVSVTSVTYEGQKAVRLTETGPVENGTTFAIVKNVSFRNGTIEAEVAGKPAANAPTDARGFIGIAFRLQGNKYEYIYLRPTNGRADDQVRRNHSVQYGSFPDYDFARMRQESPEKYESYVDLEPGVWTKIRIEVEGRTARLYVHDAEQPCLIVNDLKLEPREGAIALWSGPGTEAYFSGLKITAKTEAKIYFDRAHGEFDPPGEMQGIGSRLGYTLETAKGEITPEALKGGRLVYLRAPNGTFTQLEKTAIVQFVKNGGSLLLVLDEEQRQSLAKTGVNDIIAPFGMKLTGDTPQIDNIGAIAKAGEINHADREIPYDGGRAVIGGTPFAYQLDRQGKPGQPYAAWVKVGNGGRVIVMAEGMASLFLGEPGAVRLQVDKTNRGNTKWWGKDSAAYMEEVLAWLLAR
jgi:hypothetical protein